MSNSWPIIILFLAITIVTIAVIIYLFIACRRYRRRRHSLSLSQWLIVALLRCLALSHGSLLRQLYNCAVIIIVVIVTVKFCGLLYWWCCCCLSPQHSIHSKHGHCRCCLVALSSNPTSRPLPPQPCNPTLIIWHCSMAQSMMMWSTDRDQQRRRRG